MPTRPNCVCKHAFRSHSDGPCAACDCHRYVERPRRARGDGGLFQRADGMWIGRVDLPPGPDGKRRQKPVSSKSFDIAAAKLRKLRADVAEGRIAVTGNTTVEKWLDRWLTEIHSQRAGIRPTTIRDYRTAITRHINPTLGKKRLDKLTTDDVRRMHRAVGKRRAAEKAHVVLQRALKDAVREQMINVNVAELVDKPTYKKTRRQSMTVAVAQKIIQTAYASRAESEATRWAAAFLTGARQAELLGLRWSHVDLRAGYMDISWQLQSLAQVHGCGEPTAGVFPCGKGGPGWCPQRRWDLPVDFEHEECHRSLVLTRPKTEAGERWVPIVAPLQIKLKALHADQGDNEHGLVWHHIDGRPINPRLDQSRWTSLLAEADVDHVPMHVARHTTSTLLRSAGVDEQTRMEILGHATVDSQRVYAHADTARHQVAMAHLNELLPGAS